MGGNRPTKKKKGRASKPHAQQSRRVPAAKAPGAASPATMAPVPLSLGGTRADDSFSGSRSRKIESTSCKHVESGVNLGKLGKHFAGKTRVECYECIKLKGRSKMPKKKALWICLACGDIGCGANVREAKQIAGSGVVDQSHMILHSNTWTHPVVMQWGESLECLCLLCNAQLEYAGGDAGGILDEKGFKLQKAAALLQESLSPNTNTLKVGDVDTEQGTEVEPEGKPEVVPEVESEVKPELDLEVKPELDLEVKPELDLEVKPEVEGDSMPTVEAVRPKLGCRRVVKGLMNLGNTCFFNSVMQNLVGVSMLREYFSTEASGQEGVLRVALRRFFQEMDPSPSEKNEDGGSGSKSSVKTRSFGYSMGNGAVSPRGLFSAICTKAPRFKGFQQQDSHELLRCLLDGLHMEEESMRMPQRSALDKGPGIVTDSDAKEEQKLPDTLVEHMFGGQFSSTLSCCECGHSSVSYEPFLDLSLPIPSKQSSGKGEPFSLHLPKSIAPRSQSNNVSSNGVPSGKAIGCSPFDNKPSAKENPKKPAIIPVRDFSLQNSIAGGRAASSETSSVRDSGSAEKGSMTGDKDHGAQEVGSAVNPFPCESIANSSGTEKIDTWLDSVDYPKKGSFEEIAGSPAVDDLDIIATASGPPDLNESNDVEAHSQGEASTKGGQGFDEISTSQEMFSGQIEQGVNIPPDNGYQMMEETPVYGPQPYGGSDDLTENKNECRALVLVPSNSNGISVGDQSGINPDSTSINNSKPEPAAPLMLTARGSEEDGEEDAGLGGLFDDNESSPSTAHEYGFETPSHESSSFSLINTIASVPGLGPVLGGRSGLGRGVPAAETFPTMSLEGCLQAFIKIEVLSGENAWACDNCTRIAHAQREAELQEQEETDCSQPLPEAERNSNDIGSTCVSDGAAIATHVTVSADGDAMEEEWESVGLEDIRMEDTSTSTTSRGIVVSSVESDGFIGITDQKENGTFPELNGNQNAVGTVNGRSGVELSITGGDSSNNRVSKSLERSQSSDGLDESKGLRPVVAGESEVSTSQGEKEDAEEPCKLVECLDKKTRNSDVLKKDRKGKASVRTGLQAGASKGKGAMGAKKAEKDPPKMVTVKRDATKRLLISKAPLVLTVHLKRFAQDLHGRLSKLSGHITFHERLDLAPFLDHRNGGKPCVYQLIGTVEHSGTMRGGHYVAYVKGCKMEGKDSSDGASTWYYISDSHVRETCLESVLQSEAYLLFYERQT